PRVERTAATDDLAAESPVDGRATRDPARTHRKIRLRQRLQEFHEILRAMREVGVHFDERLITALETPLETREVRLPEALFTRAREQVNARVFLLRLAHDVLRTVGRVVVDDENLDFGRRVADRR